MIDKFGRKVNYLRLSVTDRCDLRCSYCMPKKNSKLYPKSEILSLDALKRITKVLINLGIKKIRVTGGEPLIRKDINQFLDFISSLKCQGLEEVLITTNGTQLKKYAKKADKLILATDPDREGEAISWHLVEVLKEQNLLSKIDLERVVFNEITKSAILRAMDNPRELDADLVDAYLARRALDYLVGFGISPILWRKLPGARSAGRVQSVALRLIVERESQIERFISDEFWDIEGQFLSSKSQSLMIVTIFS